MMSARPPTAGISAIKVEVTPVPPSSSPVLPTNTLTETINGQPTTVIAQSFADRIFITVTQLNKFGCLYQAVTSTNPAAFDSEVVDEASHSNLPPPLPTTSVSKLVGTEPSPAYTALYQLYVAQIASIVKHSAGGDTRPLIVSLALKPTTNADKPIGADRGYDDSDDEADSLLLTSEDERNRFIAVMEAVQKCRVW